MSTNRSRILRDYTLGTIVTNKYTVMSLNLTADWVCGFTDGEGTFFISIEKQAKMVLGKQVRLGFKITQGVKNVKVLHKIKGFFGVGTVKPQRSDRSVWEYRVSNFKTVSNHILPFFAKHKLYTTKKFDFLRFQYVHAMMMRGDHLTTEGLTKIEKVRSKMNLPCALLENLKTSNLDASNLAVLMLMLIKDQQFKDEQWRVSSEVEKPSKRQSKELSKEAE